MFLSDKLYLFAMIIDNSGNQKLTFPFFKENIPSRSVIGFVKNVVRT